jgi:hypothetical protein
VAGSSDWLISEAASHKACTPSEPVEFDHDVRRASSRAPGPRHQR